MNDWMDHEVLRQAAEAGDPSAQTTSWAVPARRQPTMPAVPLFVVLGLVAVVTVLAVVAVSALT
jgi:hypothetical protein